MQFAEVMAGRTDAELIEICTRQREDYQPEALDAAEAEVARRKLSFTQIERAHEEIRSKEQDRAANATLPLEPAFKVWALLMPGLSNLLIAKTYRIGGYDRKYEEAKAWAYGGVVLYALVFLTIRACR